jgi:hypothetical protein
VVFHEGDAAINEYSKLNTWCTGHPDAAFACLIGYAIQGPAATHRIKAADATKLLDTYTERWTAPPPLLLVVIEYE